MFAGGFAAAFGGGLGRGGGLVGDDFEAHAFAAFAGVHAGNVADGHPDVLHHAAETGGEINPVVVDGEAGGGGVADVEDDVVVFHKLHRHAGVLVYPNLDVGGLAAVAAPFVQGAQEVGFEGGVHHGGFLG